MKRFLITVLLSLAATSVMAYQAQMVCYTKAATRYDKSIDISNAKLIEVQLTREYVQAGTDIFIKIPGSARDANTVGIAGGGATQLYKNQTNNDIIMVIIGNSGLMPVGIVYTGSNGTKLLLQCIAQ